MARNEPTSHETRLWIIWSLLLGASCLSVAVGNSGPIVLPRLALILPATVYGVASAWRLYYGARRPRWNRHRLKALYVTGFTTTIAFALIEVAAFLVLTFVPVSDGTIALNTIMGNLQPLFSITAVTCWSLTALARVGNNKDCKTRGTVTLLLCGAVGTLWAAIMFLTGTPELEGAEKAANCLAGGVICFAAILLMINTSHTMRNTEENRPSPQELEAKTQEAIKRLAKRELSERELSVLSATAQGKTGKQIARELEVSVATVGSYRTRGYEKLGVKKKADFIRLLTSDKEVVSSSQKDSANPSARYGQSAPELKDSPSSHIPMQVISMSCLVAYCVYGPIDHFYQLATDDWGLGYWWPTISHLLMTGIIALSAASFSRDTLQGEKGPLPPTPVSHTSFAIFFLGLVATGYLISEAGNTLSLESGLFGLIGLGALFTYLGSGTCANKRRRGGIVPLNTMFRGFKSAAVHSPEILGVLALAALFWEDAIFCWLEFYPHSWQLLVTFNILLVVALLYKAVVALRESFYRSTALPESSTERLESYLRGRGLNDLQVGVTVLTLQGESTDTISKKLSIAPGTVGSYRSRTYAALGVHNLEELRELLNQEAHIPI